MRDTEGEGKTAVKRLAIALLLVVAACSGDTATTATAPSVPGFETYQGDGFSMLLPTSWFVLAADDLDLEAALEGIELPPGALQQTEAAFAQGGKIFAYAPDFADNLNVLEAPLPPISISGLESLNFQSLESLGATDIESEIRTLPAGQAIEFRYTLPIGEVAVEGIFVLVLTETKQWALTLTAADTGIHSDTFETMLESFREAS